MGAMERGFQDLCAAGWKCRQGAAGLVVTLAFQCSFTYPLVMSK